MKCSLGISNFLLEICSLSPFIVFLYSFALITQDREGNGNPLQYSCLEHPRVEEPCGFCPQGCTELDTIEVTWQQQADHLGRLSYFSLLFFGALHSDAYIFPFILCLSLLFFSQLFVRHLLTTVLVFSLSDGTNLFKSHFWLKGDAFGMCTEEVEDIWLSDLVKEAYDLFLNWGMASVWSIWWWKMTPWGLT